MVESFHVGIYWLGRGISEKAMVCWCLLKAFWSKSFFFFRKESIRNMESCSFAVFWFGVLAYKTMTILGQLRRAHLKKWTSFWFLHLTVVIYTPTVDKPYVSLCEHVRHKLGHVETAFLPCQDSLAAVEFGNTLAKEFSGPGVWWVVGWLDEKVLSLFLFDFQFFLCVTSFSRSGELNRVNIPKNLGLNLAW